MRKGVVVLGVALLFFLPGIHIALVAADAWQSSGHDWQTTLDTILQRLPGDLLLILIAGGFLLAGLLIKEMEPYGPRRMRPCRETLLLSDSLLNENTCPNCMSMIHAA